MTPQRTNTELMYDERRVQTFKDNVPKEFLKSTSSGAELMQNEQ